VGRFYFQPVRNTDLDDADVRRVAFSERVGLKVVTLLQGDPEEASLREVRGPVPIYTYNYMPLYAGTAGFMSVGLLAWGLIAARRRRRQTRVISESVDWREAWELAVEQLEEIKASDLLDRGEVHEFHFDISDVIREFLARHFRLDVFELTTRELMERLAFLKEDSPELFQQIEDFLLDCDLVKFARYQTSVERSQQMLETAFAIVDNTRAAAPTDNPDEDDALAESAVADLTRVALPEHARDIHPDSQWMPTELREDDVSSTTPINPLEASTRLEEALRDQEEASEVGATLDGSASDDDVAGRVVSPVDDEVSEEEADTVVFSRPFVVSTGHADGEGWSKPPEDPVTEAAGWALSLDPADADGDASAESDEGDAATRGGEEA